MEKAKVYYTKDISSESLIKIYDALNVDLKGKIGVKVSTGERGSRGYLKADIIGPLVKKLNGTIIECNTAYDGARIDTIEHLKVAEEHGFTAYANVDIMDSEGEEKIPVKNGKHLEYDIIGTHFDNYDAIVNLAHGKGHAMGGFGANLKNQSIGIASRNGKAYIHTAGKTANPDELWSNLPEQRDFIEAMAEAAKAVSDHLKENLELLLDSIQEKEFLKENFESERGPILEEARIACDCDSAQTDPVMSDLGIVASLDPVANDQAFIDMIWNSKEEGAKLLQERIDSRQGRHILEYAEELGLGTTDYELIEI